MSRTNPPTIGSAVPGGAEGPPAAATVAVGRTQPALLRLGAVTGVLGLLIELAASLLHPSHAQPNDSQAAFREYAASSNWVLLHFGQWLGVLLVATALVILGRVLAGQPGLSGALAVPGALAAALVAALFTVQMAVDGIALKAAIDAWLGAPPGGADAAFQVAEGVRGMEKGLSAFFHLLNGTTLLLLGLAIVVGRTAPRWMGAVGALSGIGYLIGGIATAYTGFSATASTILLAPLALDMVFLLSACTWMWRIRTAAVARAGS
jgi:hypothetical protein